MRVSSKLTLCKCSKNIISHEELLRQAHRGLLEELERQNRFIDDIKIHNPEDDCIVVTSHLFVLTQNDIAKITHAIENYPELRDRLYSILVEGK